MFDDVFERWEWMGVVGWKMTRKMGRDEKDGR
jgi:hypothetical protein